MADERSPGAVAPYPTKQLVAVKLWHEKKRFLEQPLRLLGQIDRRHASLVPSKPLSESSFSDIGTCIWACVGVSLAACEALFKLSLDGDDDDAQMDDRLSLRDCWCQWTIKHGHSFENISVSKKIYKKFTRGGQINFDHNQEAGTYTIDALYYNVVRKPTNPTALPKPPYTRRETL